MRSAIEQDAMNARRGGAGPLVESGGGVRGQFHVLEWTGGPYYGAPMDRGDDVEVLT